MLHSLDYLSLICLNYEGYTESCKSCCQSFTSARKATATTFQGGCTIALWLDSYYLTGKLTRKTANFTDTTFAIQAQCSSKYC